MPNPSTTTSQNINTELGVPATSNVSLTNNWVRNVAAISSGAISYGKCRWGINFPGGDAGLIYAVQYNTTNNLNMYASSFILYDPPFSSAYAACTLYARSNGQLSLYTNFGASDQNILNRTWLTSGVAGDYTIQLQRTSGSTLSGDATNTDLALSTTRVWTLAASIGPPGPGLDYQYAIGNLIIKDTGGTLITRPITFDAQAEVSQ